MDDIRRDEKADGTRLQYEDCRGACHAKGLRIKREPHFGSTRGFVAEILDDEKLWVRSIHTHWRSFFGSTVRTASTDRGLAR